MGGKRSDQYNIDPAEGSSTNHQGRGEGRSGDEKLMDENKRELQSNPHDQPMIPRSHTNPAAREMQERKASAKQSQDDADATQSADDRVDEASQESFPASDPPAQP